MLMLVKYYCYLFINRQFQTFKRTLCPKAWLENDTNYKKMYTKFEMTNYKKFKLNHCYGKYDIFLYFRHNIIDIIIFTSFQNY